MSDRGEARRHGSELPPLNLAQSFYLDSPEARDVITYIELWFQKEMCFRPVDVKFSWAHVAVDANGRLHKLSPDFGEEKESQYIQTRILFVEIPHHFFIPEYCQIYIKKLQFEGLLEIGLQDTAIEFFVWRNRRRSSIWFPPLIAPDQIPSYFPPPDDKCFLPSTMEIKMETEDDAMKGLSMLTFVAEDVPKLMKRSEPRKGQEIYAHISIIPALIDMIIAAMEKFPDVLADASTGEFLRTTPIPKLSKIQEKVNSLLNGIWRVAASDFEKENMDLIMEGLYKARRTLPKQLHKLHYMAKSLEALDQ